MLALRFSLPQAVARPTRMVERNTMVYRHSFMVIFSGFFEPVFYLISMSVGVAHLVGDVPGPGGKMISYAAFVAPGLLAASAMNGSSTHGPHSIW